MVTSSFLLYFDILELEISAIFFFLYVGESCV